MDDENEANGPDREGERERQGEREREIDNKNE